MAKLRITKFCFKIDFLEKSINFAIGEPLFHTLIHRATAKKRLRNCAICEKVITFVTTYYLRGKCKFILEL